MFLVRDEYPMSMIEQAMEDQRHVEVLVYMPEYGEDRIVRIDNLHRRVDGWGVEHIEGFIIENGGLVRATLYDNANEAHPLNLR